MGGGAQIDRVKDAPESGPGGTTVGVKCDCDVSQWACRLRLDPEFAKRGHAKASLQRAAQLFAACAEVLTQWRSPSAYAGRLCTSWRLHPSVQHGLDGDKPAAASVKVAPRGAGRLHGQRMFCSYDARDCKQAAVWPRLCAKIRSRLARANAVSPDVARCMLSVLVACYKLTLLQAACARRVLVACCMLHAGAASTWRVRGEYAACCESRCMFHVASALHYSVAVLHLACLCVRTTARSDARWS